MDLIDLGNLTFDVLKEKHGEIEESRILFLYCITNNENWTVLDSNKILYINKDGIFKNFKDSDIETLQNTWVKFKNLKDNKVLIEKIEKMRSKFDREAPKDGDIWEFGNKPTPFKKITF